MREKNVITIGEQTYYVDLPCSKSAEIVSIEINRLVKDLKAILGAKTVEKILNEDTMDLFFSNFYNLTDSGIALTKKELRTLVRASFLGSVYTVIDEVFEIVNDIAETALASDTEEGEDDVPEVTADNPEIQ